MRRITAIALAALTGAFALAALACSPAPAPAGPTADEIRAIVKAEVQNAPAPAGPSTSEISTMVEQAIMSMDQGDQLSAADVESIVESVVMEASGDTLTAAAVQSIVDDAIAAMPAPAMDSMMPSGEPVKIGTILDYTGDLGIYGPPIRNGADIAAEMINNAGGVLGRPVQAVHRDGGSSSQVSTDAARALVTADGVQAIVGALGSGYTIALAQAVTIPNEVVLISPASTSPAISVLDDNDYLFRTAVSDAAQGVVLARLANELGFETAATIYINNPYGEGLSRVFTENFEALGGTVTAAVPQESGQSSYQSEIENAVDGDPDVLIAMSYPESTQVYIRQALEGDYIDSFMFVDGNKSQTLFDALFDSIGGSERVDGSHGTAPGAQPTDESEVFTAIYKQRYGSLNAEPFIGEAFDAFIIAALAIEKAGENEASAIRDAMREVANAPGTPVGPGEIDLALQLIRAGEDINYEGVAGSQDFDENGDVVNTIEIWKIEDGQVVSTGRYESP